MIVLESLEDGNINLLLRYYGGEPRLPQIMFSFLFSTAEEQLHKP